MKSTCRTENQIKRQTSFQMSSNLQELRRMLAAPPGL